jgi:hypothetical protein
MRPEELEERHEVARPRHTGCCTTLSFSRFDGAPRADQLDMERYDGDALVPSPTPRRQLEATDRIDPKERPASYR